VNEIQMPDSEIQMLPEIQMPDSEIQMLTLPQMSGKIGGCYQKKSKDFYKKKFFFIVSR
jgi:hypothetical protein